MHSLGVYGDSLIWGALGAVEVWKEVEGESVANLATANM